MTGDVDLLAEHPEAVARELAGALHELFGIAVRVPEIGGGKAFRVYQVRKEGNRHLADVRRLEFPLGEITEREGIRYVPVAVLAAMKVVAFARRRYAPKGATDLADLRRLLLSHPELRREPAGVAEAIQRVGGDDDALETWRQLLCQPLVSDEETDEGY